MFGAAELEATRRVAVVEDDAGSFVDQTPNVAEQGLFDHLGGGDDGAVVGFAEPFGAERFGWFGADDAGEGLFEGVDVGVDDDQRFGSFAVGGCGGGALRHFDEGVGAALGGGAPEPVGGHLVAVFGFGLLPVGVEELLFDAAQGFAEGLAAGRVEPGVEAGQIEDRLRHMGRPG